ncbi:hypothetical protein JZ751_005971 [Albula glossodonta]|uniref:F-box protein n=1 Tax=Albula glossodonta TaxID=121402 RepID=A0A8T2P3I4_9TELE|nr:hypothetical protein JZ751_005971 [Albula glossodonta]
MFDTDLLSLQPVFQSPIGTFAFSGCLEEGLEAILKATEGNLLILKVSHCPNILTDRSLWLASCYCRALQAVTYRSSTDPVGQEVIWALGAGCRDIISLQVAPLHPWSQRLSKVCSKVKQGCGLSHSSDILLFPLPASNRPASVTGACRPLADAGHTCGPWEWEELAVASRGSRNCMRLQVLELDHVSEVNQELAAEVCREGLKGLEMLVLTSTPVTPKALLHFNSVCRNLKSIVVQIGIADYFDDPNSPEARKLFDEMVEKLQAVPVPSKHPSPPALFTSTVTCKLSACIIYARDKSFLITPQCTPLCINTV